jgi:adenylate cyclase class IV
VTVCLDTIEGIGSFVELEQLAEESMAGEVSVRLANLAEELGLLEPEPRSYLGLVLRNAQGKS